MLRLKHIILYVAGLKYFILLSYASYIFCSHHQGSTSVIGWGFWGISIPGRLCIALCKVPVQCHRHSLSRCSVPLERGERHWDHKHLFIFSVITALDQVEGIQKMSLICSGYRGGHGILRLGLTVLTLTSLRRLKHTAHCYTNTERKWIYFLLPSQNSYSLSDRLHSMFLWIAFVISALDYTAINMAPAPSFSMQVPVFRKRT